MLHNSNDCPQNIEGLIEEYFIKENLYTKISKKIHNIESEDDIKSLKRKLFEELLLDFMSS